MNVELTTIINLAGLSDDDYPEQVREALAFQAAAAALAADVAAESAVDLTAATSATITKVFSAAVAFERDHGAAQALAGKLLALAAGRVETAWSNAVPAIAKRCAAEFDAAAGDLVAALSGLGPGVEPAAAVAEHWTHEYDALRRALAVLDRLRKVRDAVAFRGGRADAVSNEYEASSRTLVFDSQAAYQAFRRTIGRSGTDANYYLAAATAKGVTIKWQDPNQQAEQTWPASIKRSRDQLAATFAARTAEASR